MKSFWEISTIKEDMGMPGGSPMGGGDMGLPGGGVGGGAPMGGGPPMGGGMGGLGGGLGGPPMGGGGGTAGQLPPATQLKTSSVWSVWKKLLDGKSVNKTEKSSGHDKSDMVKSPQPQQQPSPQQSPAPPTQPSQQPSPF